jgi:hypothetical protein
MMRTPHKPKGANDLAALEVSEGSFLNDDNRGIDNGVKRNEPFDIQ